MASRKKRSKPPYPESGSVMTPARRPKWFLLSAGTATGVTEEIWLNFYEWASLKLVLNLMIEHPRVRFPRERSKTTTK
jgi:hypothetical protein